MDKVKVSLDSFRAKIVFDNASRRNAIDDEMLSRLIEVLSDLRSDPRCRMIMFRGANGMFCAGRDVGGIAVAELKDPLQALADLLKAIRTFPKPTLAVVEGHAVGLGMAIACTCDIVLASENAKFGVPEAKLGLTPSLTAVTTVRALPRKVALDLLFSGRFLTAQEAAHYGLVSRTTNSADLETTLATLAEQVAAMSPNALERAKGLVLSSDASDIDVAIEQAVIVARGSMSDPDAAEGIAAFQQKRKPRWAITA